MKLRLIDSGFAHTPTGQICDFYTSDKIEWDRGPWTTEANGPKTVLVDGHIATDYELGDIALLLEPRELIPGLYHLAETNQHGFDYILTHDSLLLSKVPNALAYTFGGCWIEPQDVNIHKKSRNVSIIASSKNQTVGHKLRHGVISRLRGWMDVYGRGYNPIDKKIHALRDHRYSITIENVAQDNFFTEKLIDCFATGTIPIYWGMPNISRHFNPDGMLRFSSISELNRILIAIETDAEDIYFSKMDAIRENFERCKYYFAPEDSIYKALNSKGIV